MRKRKLFLIYSLELALKHIPLSVRLQSFSLFFLRSSPLYERQLIILDKESERKEGTEGTESLCTKFERRPQPTKQFPGFKCLIIGINMRNPFVAELFGEIQFRCNGK